MTEREAELLAALMGARALIASAADAIVRVSRGLENMAGLIDRNPQAVATTDKVRAAYDESLAQIDAVIAGKKETTNES